MSFQVPLAGQSINNATIGIETNISSSSASIGNLSVVNATIGQLSTTIFNPASVTTATLNATSGIIDTLVVNNSITELNVVQLNVSQKNVSNLSAINISAEEITCNNLQPLLTAGTNISILDGVISAVNEALLPADATFDSVTSDVVNALYIDANNVSIDNLSIDQKLSVAGNVNISGTLSASNLSTGSLKFGAGLLYDPFDSEVEVEVNKFIQEGSDLPVTSWAVYKAIDNQFSNIQAQTCYRLYETDFKLENTQVAATQNVIIFYTDYYPQYEESKIIVEFCYSYSVAGHGSDGITTYIQIGRNNNTNQETIQMLFQDWTDDGGGGTRSGASSSIMGMYVNDDTIGKYHRIKMRVSNNSDDLWQLSSTSYPVVKITEFIPIAGISNPNIRLGNGNISCGNISCNSLTITDITIDNVITNYNVNVGGDMITVGFPISGEIASKSIVRLAGANTVLNYGDLSWDGTTFNLSTRQANKNFKVSFGQQDYFEVNTNNTSCRSLYVNGNISMSGTLTIGGALNFTNAIIQNSLLVNGLITASSAEFSDDVTFDDNVSMHKRLNVSNVSVTQGLTVYGNISTRGNISANSIYAPNLSTASLKPGTNITIVDGFINAYVQGGTLVDCGSLQVDTDANIFGILNVSKTSTFSESLNVCNIIYAGKTGQHDGSVVVYSQSIGNNWATKYDGTVLNMSATGTTTQVNTWLGENKMLSITPAGINICGTLKADSIDADYTNFSTVNLSVQNATVENTSGINASFNQLSGSIIDVTQLNGTNGHFTSSLTAANISTGSLVFGSGLNFFLGTLSVDFTTSETQVAELENSLAREVETNSLHAGIATIDVLSVATFINVPQINCSDIDSNSGTIDVLDCTNISTDVLYVNTSINTCHLNCSTLNIVDTIGAGGLNVSGAAYFDFLFASNPCYFETNDVYFGKPQATGTTARLDFWSQITPVTIGLRFGIDNDDIVRMNIPTSGGSTAYNILMGNVSTMTMTNTSTRFHTDLRATNIYLTENICGTNASFNNVSITNLTVTSISSPDLNTTQINCSDIDSNTGTIDVLDSTNISTVYFSSDNISTDRLDVNTSINAQYLNSSSLKTLALNVSGLTNLDSLSVSGVGTTSLQVNEVGVGKLTGTGTRSVVTFWSPITANQVGLRVGLDADGVARLAIPYYGQFMTFNINISNVSYLTMKNNSTRFERPVAFGSDVTASKITSTNICNTNLSTTKCTITTLRGTTLNGTTINASNLNISTKLSVTNISGTNATFTSLTASNVQPTLIAGTNISINGNTINSLGTAYVAGTGINISGDIISATGTILSAGDNIQITSDVISTLPNINVSSLYSSENICGNHVSFTNLSCVNITATSITASNVQPLITDGSLTIANTSGLQTALNNKQNFILDGGLAMIKVNGLTSALFGKQPTINTSSLVISNTSGLQAALNAKQATLIAGTGITFVGNTINAAGTTYTTGNNIQIVGDVISTLATINVSNISSINLSVTTGTITTLRSTTQNTNTLNSSSVNTDSLSVVNNFNAGQINFGLLIGPTINASTTNSSTSNAVNLNGSAVNGSTIKGNNISVLGTGTLDSYLIRSTTTNANTLNCSNINVSTKLSVTNISFTNSSVTNETVTTLRGTTLNGTTINASNLNISTKLSVTNISGTNATFTSLTASNVQPTLIAGTGINISGTTISSSATDSFNAGNNIQIVGNVISTLATINVSNISTDRLDVNTSVNARYLNSSSLKTLELNVSGLTSLDSLSVSGAGATSLQVNEVGVGRLTGTGTRSVVTFWSHNNANQVGLRMGLDGDGVARLAIPYYGQFMTFNINISNVSYLTMKNNSTRFERPVIFGSDVTASKITSTNICNTNLSTTNCTITTLRGTTLNGTTINASNLNISTKLTTTNISATNITATSITAPNVQPTLTAGTNISILGNVISSTAGGTNLTEGNNIQIVGDVISTTTNLNSSNISSINGSFTNLTCSGNISFSIGNYLFRNPLDGILNVCSTTVSTDLIGPLRTTFNASLLQAKKLNVSNISFVAGLGGGVLDMGELGRITKAFSVNSNSVNSSTLNASNIIVNTKVTTTNLSATNITATSITAPNVQPTLTAGTNISILGNVISSTGGGTNLTEGNNIQIVGDVISTTANLNASNIIVNTKVTTTTINTCSINCSDIDSNLGTIDQFDSTFATLTNLSSTNISATQATISNSAIIARTLIHNPFPNAMCIAHSNFTGQDDYALNQYAGGSTSLNSPTGVSIVFRNGGNQVATLGIDGYSSNKLINCSNISNDNFSGVNISGSVITATSIVAPNVQPTLTTSNNIQIIADTISTTDVINSTTHNVSTINTSNISASNISLTGDLTMGGYISRKNSFIRRYRVGTETLSSNSYQVMYGADQYSNDDLVIVTAIDLYTIAKAGRYKVSTNVLFGNGSYTDRMNWRLRLFKNGSHDTALGQAHCYTRHRDYAEYGSAYHTTIVDFVVGDTFYYRVDCNKASATGFTSDMTGSQVLSNTFLEIEYLGE